MEGLPILKTFSSVIRQADVMLSALIWTVYSLPKPPIIFQRRTSDSYISYRRIYILLFNMIPSNAGTVELLSLEDHQAPEPNDEPVSPPRAPKITQTSPVGPLAPRIARAFMSPPPISVRTPKLAPVNPRGLISRLRRPLLRVQIF